MERHITFTSEAGDTVTCSVYDIADTLTDWYPDAPAEVTDAIRTDRVDALFVVAPTTSETVTDLVTAMGQVSGNAVFVPIADARAIARRLPALESVEIVRGAFGGSPPRPAASFETLGVSARLMALVDEEPVCRGALGTVETNNAPAEMLSVKKRPDISSRFQRVS